MTQSPTNKKIKLTTTTSITTTSNTVNNIRRLQLNKCNIIYYYLI